MTDEREPPNPWDPPAEEPTTPEAPAAAQPGSWQSDQTGYGHQMPAPPAYGQPPSGFRQAQFDDATAAVGE